MAKIALRIILTMATTAIGVLLQGIQMIFPELHFENFVPIITTFYSFLNQGLNFLYFMLGNVATPLFIELIVSIIAIKHIIIPAIISIKKILIRS